MIPKIKKVKPDRSKSLIREYIADMHTDGLRFSETVKAEMKSERERLYCSYSGLPSPYAYE